MGQLLFLAGRKKLRSTPIAFEVKSCRHCQLFSRRILEINMDAVNETCRALALAHEVETGVMPGNISLEQPALAIDNVITCKQEIFSIR
jgi:hypothetical protein